MTDTISLGLIVEMDLMDDAMRSLSRAHGALSSRHGERFRDYERRLEDMLDADIGRCAFEKLDDGRFVLIPPIEWRAMIDEGVVLGVI